MKIKKLAVLAAAIAIPVGGLASLAAISAGTAGASGAAGDKGTYTCAITGVSPAPASNVVFQAPGITVAGSVSESTLSKTKTTAAVLPASSTCGTVNGAVKALTINAVNPPCSATTTPALGPVCTAGDWAYGSWNSFIASGTSTIVGGLPHPKFTIDTDTFTGNTTTAAVASTCPSGEAGFTISGTVTPLEGYTAFSLTACLGIVNLPASSAGTLFGNDVSTLPVASVQIDPANSTVTVS